jgi:Tfp pilus assembly protein PilX
MRSNRKRPSSEKGFALATALMACAILFALAMLIIQLSTGDLKVSSRNVGDKKALSAAETGIHQMIRAINVLPAVNEQTLAPVQQNNQQVNAAADPTSRYTFGSIRPAPGSDKRSLVNYSDWEQQCYVGSATGFNTNYPNSSVTIDVGLGYAVPTEAYR